MWTGLRFPEGHVYEDIDITYRIFDRCLSIRCLDQPLYLRRLRTGSITQTVTVDNMRDWHLAMEHFESYIAANTPDIFSPWQLQRHRQKRLNRLIIDYVKLVSRQGTCSVPFATDLKEKMISFEKQSGIQNSPLRIRAAYRMILSCPGLIRPVYRLYYQVRMWVLKTPRR